MCGGISRTVDYKGNKIDIGGHRFFSKSPQIMTWWLKVMPLQGGVQAPPDLPAPETQGLRPDPDQVDQVMLLRKRLSRIYFLRNLFDYPITLTRNTIKNLGLLRLIIIAYSYIKAMIIPIRPERSLEDFFVNRFGRTLFNMFFRDYTQKVWGVPCSEISADWGMQRVKGLSVFQTIMHAVKNYEAGDQSLSQKNTETSLINQFLYPKFGPGQLWEAVAGKIEKQGGQILYNHEVIALHYHNDTITAVSVLDRATNKTIEVKGGYFFSTMPVKDLIRSMGHEVPKSVRDVSEGLVYRDFITVGILLKKLKLENPRQETGEGSLVKDNWIYIQEKEVQIGRLQIFNNWSPYMVKEENTVWVGTEYFCQEGDALWRKDDQELSALAKTELAMINIIDPDDVLDSVVIKVPKTYPAYLGTYANFQTIRDFTDRFSNLFLLGRNGMHRYNNMDHSMLTAMTAVDNIISGRVDKNNIWDVNTEQAYHETK